MDRLKLTHALVCDFLRKQFGPKVAKLVYKDGCSAYSPTVDDERMDLESVVEYGLSSVGKKRKLPSDNSVLMKKAKVGGAHASLGDESSGSESDTESSEEEVVGKKTAVVPSADLQKPLNAKKASESSTSSSDEDSDALPNGKVVKAPKKFPGPATAARKPIKKATSSSGSSSECEETLSKSVPTPVVGKSTVRTPAKNVVQQAPAKTTLVLTPRSVIIKKKAVSSSSDTESSDSKDEPIRKTNTTAQVTLPAVQTAAKCSFSSSSSSTDSGPPAKSTPVVKGGNVSNLKGKRGVNEVAKVKREVSSSSSSDSGPPMKNIGPAKNSKVAPKHQVTKAKTAPPSDSSSDEDSSDEEPLKGKPIAAARPTAAAIVKKKDSSSSASSGDKIVVDLAKTRALLKAGLENADVSSSSASSSTENEQLPEKPWAVGLKGTVGLAKKAEPLAKGTPTKTVAQVAKKQSSSTSSSDSSSEEDALPAKLVVGKKCPTVSNVQPRVVEPALQKGVHAGQSKRNSSAAVTSKAKSSESSSDESDKIEMTNTGKNTAPAVVKAAVSEDSSSSSDTDSEEEEEETMPVGKAKVVGKGSAASGRINALAKQNGTSSSSGEDTETDVKKSGAEVNGLSNTVIGKDAQDSSSSSTSSSDDEDKKSTPVAKKQVVKEADNDRKSKETKGNHVSSQAKKGGEPFRRFPITKEELNPQFRDNSFQSKNDKWGERAYADLSSVKGKNFRKEKTKKKRGSYSGGRIDPNVVGAVKFNFDD